MAAEAARRCIWPAKLNAARLCAEKAQHWQKIPPEKLKLRIHEHIR
jgi:hypothetical protein